MCGLISVIIALVLLIDFLISVRSYLQRKHQLEEVLDIAKALYTDQSHLAVRFLELRQDVGLNLVEVSWVAFLEPKSAKGLKRLSVQTRELASTKYKSLDELQKKLVEELLKKMTNPSSAGAGKTLPGVKEERNVVQKM
ncbi:hypothetical protein SLS61_007283 [Didymella pomorum]